MPQLSHWPGGAFSITTSDCTANFLRISRPSSVSRLSVIESLLRISCRNCPPTSSPVSLSRNMYCRLPNGVFWRRGSPPGGSTWMTSAPNSANIEEHQCPIIMRVEQRSEEHTSELQSLAYLVCRLLLEKKKKR